MPTIKLLTYINAPREVCFNLSRSVELHKLSTQPTQEEVIEGRQSGLFEYGETVTWRAKHLGKFRTMKMKITGMKPPLFFEDQMLEGPFKSIVHQHFFIEYNGVTTMQDVFKFKSPYSVLGMLFNFFFLKKYMKKLLLQRNQCIKEQAEAQTDL